MGRSFGGRGMVVVREVGCGNGEGGLDDMVCGLSVVVKRRVGLFRVVCCRVGRMRDVNVVWR